MATLHNSVDGGNHCVAVIVPSKPEALKFTYLDLKTHVSAFQAKLAAIGITEGSVVSITTANSYEFIVSFLATTWQRGIAAPLNPAYKQEEFEFYIQDVKSALVLVPKGAFELSSAAVKAARNFNAAIAEIYWDLNRAEVALDVKQLDQLDGKGVQPILAAEPEDIALVLHTRWVRRMHSFSEPG